MDFKFSGHETFAFRYAWLPKAYNAVVVLDLRLIQQMEMGEGAGTAVLAGMSALVGDAVGTTPLYEGISGNDVATQEFLSKGERARRTVQGGSQLTLSVIGAGQLMKSANPAAQTGKLSQTAKTAPKNTFPQNADDLLPELPRDAKGHIHPNSKTRIRPASHPMKPGETYSPRHHGQHYHVETRADVTKSWNNKGNVTKIKPDNYVQGEGTGFVPDESFPGQ